MLIFFLNALSLPPQKVSSCRGSSAGQSIGFISASGGRQFGQMGIGNKVLKIKYLCRGSSAGQSIGFITRRSAVQVCSSIHTHSHIGFSSILPFDTYTLHVGFISGLRRTAVQVCSSIYGSSVEEGFFYGKEGTEKVEILINFLDFSNS